MTNAKMTKKALLSSALSLVLCISMLLGTTFAWFTDSVTSANNIIQSGNLDVEMYWADGTKQVPTLDSADWANAATSDPIFNYTNWEPGFTQVRHIQIANEGSLALRYKVHIVANGEISELTDVIDVYYFDPAEQISTRDDLSEINKIGTLTEVLANLGSTALGKLDAGQADTITLAFKMQESAGNEYEDLSIGSFSIELLATQAETESDSFGTDYDSLALFPDGSYRIPDVDVTVEGTTGTQVIVQNETKTLTVKATTGNEGQITTTVVSTGTSENVFTIAEASGLNVASYDIKVTGQEVGSAVEVTLFIGRALTSVLLYHNGEAMNTSDYNYDPTTGNLTFVTTEFSTFEVTYGEQGNILNSFEDITASRGADGVHVIGADFTASNIIFFGNGTTNTVDLNGKVITAGKPEQYIAGAQNGAVLILEGNGTINAGKGFMTNKENAKIIINGGTYNTTQTGTLNGIKHCSVAQNNSTIVINGGTFTTDVVDACLFFATSNARIEINGGFFENTANDTPDLLSMGTNKGNTNRIVITGGTFVNWNPLNDRMCYTGEWPENGEAAFGGPWMLIPGGYTVVSEAQANGDVWYTVVPVTNN